MQKATGVAIQPLAARLKHIFARLSMGHGLPRLSLNLVRRLEYPN
jgi:hypothetical protein